MGGGIGLGGEDGCSDDGEVTLPTAAAIGRFLASLRPFGMKTKIENLPHD
jgi:hypothetical protein